MPKWWNTGRAFQISSTTAAGLAGTAAVIGGLTWCSAAKIPVWRDATATSGERRPPLGAQLPRTALGGAGRVSVASIMIGMPEALGGRHPRTALRGAS